MTVSGSVIMIKGPVSEDVIIRKMHTAFARELDIEANVQLIQRNRIIATWNNDKPTFIKTAGKRRGRVFMSIRLGGSKMGKNKYIWVGFGTRVRYAHMSADFQAKTKKGLIGSRPGRGKFSHLGLPLPGIKGREWDKKIAKDRTPKLHKRIKIAGRNALTGAI